MVTLPRGRRRVEVRGESNYQSAIKRIAKRYRDHTSVDFTATLVREPSNKHDRNAVMVRLEGSTVGYLSREDAIRYQPLLQRLEAAGQVAEVHARLTGGLKDYPSYGVKLSIADPDKADVVLNDLPQVDDPVSQPAVSRGLLSRLRRRT